MFALQAKAEFLKRFGREYGYGGLLDQLYPCEVSTRHYVGFAQCTLMLQLYTLHMPAAAVALLLPSIHSITISLVHDSCIVLLLCVAAPVPSGWVPHEAQRALLGLHRQQRILPVSDRACV